MIYLLIFNPITLLLIYMLYAYLFKHQNANVIVKILYWAVTGIGAIIDCVVHLTYGTIIFADWPREWLLTQRIERSKSLPGYRGGLALALCDLLNYFLPEHCRG